MIQAGCDGVGNLLRHRNVLHLEIASLLRSLLKLAEKYLVQVNRQVARQDRKAPVVHRLLEQVRDFQVGVAGQPFLRADIIVPTH